MKPHAKDVLKTFSPQHASSSVELGADIVSKGMAPEPDDTTHFVVLDRDGMAVSNTYTLEGGYGSHVVVAGTGILLNNEMGDFNKKPGTTDLTGNIGTPANLIAPGKRMLSSMSPVIVTRNGKVALITGSPGRTHDHQHGARCGAERDGLRHDGTRRGRCAAPASPVAA